MLAGQGALEAVAFEERDAGSVPVLTESRLPRTQAAAVQRHCSASSAAHRTPATQESKQSGSTSGESPYTLDRKLRWVGDGEVCARAGKRPGAEPALFGPRNRLRRGSCDYLAGAGRGEPVDSALLPVAPAIAPHRGHFVVVSRLRLDWAQAYTEDRI